MFRKSLEASLKNIFDLPKVTYDQPSEEREQDCIFVSITDVKTTFKELDKKALCRATGELTVYAQNNKLPFGFFQKKIKSAQNSDTINFFFYNVEENLKYFGNLVERKCNFIYFYSTQYDPDVDLIESVELDVEYDEEE